MQQHRQEQHQLLQKERAKRQADLEQEQQCYKNFLNGLDNDSQSALVLAINQSREAAVEALIAAKARCVRFWFLGSFNLCFSVCAFRFRFNESVAPSTHQVTMIN